MHAEGRPSAQMGRLRREGRDGGAEVERVARSCLRVSASRRENLLQPIPRSGRCHGNEPRNVSTCRRQSRPQRCGDAEALGSCLRVSASRRENPLQPMPRSGRCHGNGRRNVSKRMRQSRPQRRGDAEALGSCLRVSASRRENLLQPVDPKSGSCRPGANGTGPFQPQVRGEVSDGSGRTSLP